MPLLILAFLLADLLSVVFLLIDYKLWREWHEFRNTAADAYATRCLYGAIALLAFIVSGKRLMMFLLSKTNRKEEEPRPIKGERFSTVERPDGTRLYIEEYGNPAGQPILFVHGWNANRTEWFYQCGRFAKDYRLIFFD